MLSFLILLLTVAILVAQISLDRRNTVLSPHILFQIYFIIQLPLNLFLGTNYYLPRFEALSPLTSTADIAKLGSYIIVAQLIFITTIYMAEARPAAPPTVAAPWPRTRVNLIAAGMLLIGYVAFFSLIYINGGFAAFAETREAWRTAGVGGQGWVLFPATTMPAIAMCAIMVTNRDQFAGRTGIVKLFLLYAVVAFPASQLGFRALIFLPLLQAGFFYHSFIRRIPGRHILVGSLALMVAFTLYGIQREVPYRESHGSYLEYLRYIYLSRPDITYTVVLRSMGADIVQQVIDHMRTFGDYVLLYPALVEAVTIAVPSGLWPDKPLPLTVQFSRNLFGIDGGVSPTIVGEGYWHGALPGLVLMMIIVGLLHAYFRWLQRQSGTKPASALLMLSIYPSLIMMAETFQGYFNGIVLIFIVNWLFRRVTSMHAVATAMTISPKRRELAQ